jgi:hypothetical protein
MKRYAWMAVAVFAFAACSDSHDRSPGSQTHFLQTCDASCAAPYECLCGVCTVQCSKDAQCSSHASGAECTDARPGGDRQCNADAPVCDVTCNGDGDCASLGSAFGCSAGRCRALPMSIDSAMHDSGTHTGASDSGVPPDAEVMATPICDGSDDIRLAMFHTSGYGNPLTDYFMQPFGIFAAIDGHCRYYGTWTAMRGVVTGTLDAADAEQLASDVHWSNFASFDGYMSRSPDCSDGGGAVTTDGKHSFACVCGCDPAAPPGLEPISEAARQWLMRLAMTGTPLDGPVSAVASVFGGGVPPRGGPAPSGDPQPWPLSSPITDIVASENDLGDGQRFDDPKDSAALRAMRNMALMDSAEAWQVLATDGTKNYLLYVRDELDADVNAQIAAFYKVAMGDGHP